MVLIFFFTLQQTKATWDLKLLNSLLIREI